MRRLFVSITLALGLCLSASAQTEADSTSTTLARDAKNSGNKLEKYRRSSLYSVLITHPTAPYGNEIRQAFLSMPMPDKFNDHNISVREFESSMKKMKRGGKEKTSTNLNDADNFITQYGIPRALVAKWFDRDPEDGSFDVELIQERGYYDASQADIAASMLQERTVSILGDAGEDLIGKTFMIVNDITFVDKGKNSAAAAAGIRVLGGLAGAFLGSGVSDMADLAAAGVNQIDGFSVNIVSYLYRLVWNEDVEGEFYSQYWINPDAADPQRKAAFEKTDLFKMEYIGESSTSASIVESKSFSKFTKEQQMLKVCARAVDKSIVQLQRTYEQFRVNTPIYKIEEGGLVKVQIGLKEGVNLKSQYEVLMPQEDEKGHTTYKRVAMLKPVEGQIWDNRFGALEDKQAIEEARKEGKNVKETKDDDGEGGNVYLDATTFKATIGANQIMPGYLVREVTIK